MPRATSAACEALPPSEVRIPRAALNPATSSASVNGLTRTTGIPSSVAATASAAVKTIAPLAAPGEAGAKFWEALRLANKQHNYAAAIQSLEQAVAIHDKRRIEHLGKVQNPISDRYEEIFLRSGEELKAYWQILAKLSALAPDVAKQDPAQAIDALVKEKTAAETASFFSFGTNDLTQTTLGISRDDYTSFRKDYEDRKIWPSDPFAVLDQEGVGKLVKMAVEDGRKTRPGLEIGICGEHGGEPSSVQFCYRVGMDYVSCSPYRVPIARLAAAQAAISCDKAEAMRTA